MEAIRKFLESIENAIKPIWGFVDGFLQKEWYIIYACISIIVIILLIAGLIAMLKKMPKFFIFLVVLIAIIAVCAWFIYYKDASAKEFFDYKLNLL